jgi:ATP-binding cassette subfamily C protein LapB
MALAEDLGVFVAGREQDEAAWNRGRSGVPAIPRLEPSVWLGSLVLNLLGLGLPIVLLQVYDRILPYQATETLALLVIGLTVVLLADATLRTVRGAITGWSAARFEHLAACSATERLLATTIGEFEKDSPGVHLDRLAAINVMKDFYAGQAKLLLLDMPFVWLFLGLIYFIAGWVVFVPLCIFAVLAAVSLVIGLWLRRALADRATLDDRRYSFVIEALSGIHTIKLLAMEPLMQRRYERLQESTAAASYLVTFIGNLAQGTGWFFSNLTMVAVAAGGALVVMEGGLSIGGLAACTLLAGRSVQPILRALGLWAQYQNISIAKDRLTQIFDVQAEATEASAACGSVKGEIRIDGVSFSYGKEEPVLLDSIRLEVRPGEVIGISGGSGSGKSTLLMLIMGLLKPTDGKVRIDGRDIGDIDPFQLRRQVAFLPQNAVLFQGSIIDNLTLFQGSTAVEAALSAARMVGVDHAIRHLPDGYRTEVGRGASMELPVGLKHGIAMARALAGKPRIILFDEANSGLDSAADGRLKEALAALKGEATIVMVSHRPSLLNLADRRYDLIEGKLSPQGSGVPARKARGGDAAESKTKSGEAPSEASL